MRPISTVQWIEVADDDIRIVTSTREGVMIELAKHGFE